MNRSNRKISLGLCVSSMTILMAFSLPSIGQQNVSESALSYIDSYVNMRFEELPKYYSNTTTFQDPTLELISTEAARTMVGEDQIMNKLHQNFAGILNPHYKMITAFTAGPYTIITGVFEYDQNGTAFGGPDILFHFSLKNTTIIVEANGKIGQHIDYMDYAEWMRQYKNQQTIKK